MEQISILGCGWLGLPLAKRLLKENFSIKGSTTSEHKFEALKGLGIEPFVIVLDSESISGNIENFLNETSILIINIPPQLRKKKNSSFPNASTNSEKEFVKKIKILIPFIERSKVKNVLFVSSTSVYGTDNETITEDNLANPDTESGKQLLEAETLLFHQSHFRTTILRFGGLVGEDRNPIRFLAGKENLDNPEAPINLIHQEDAIGIIVKIITRESWNEIYNGVCPYHPTREAYYTQKAAELTLPLPKFNHSKPSVGKLILSDKVQKMLDYRFTNIP